MGKQINAVDRELYTACAKGQNAKVVALIAAGADVAHVDPTYGYTPLHAAAEAGHLDCLNTLIQARRSCSDPGADARDEHGQTGLMIASYQGHVEVVQMLLAAGAEPRLSNTEGTTAAQFAGDEGFADIVDLLAAQIDTLSRADTAERDKERAQEREQPEPQGAPPPLPHQAHQEGWQLLPPALLAKLPGAAPPPAPQPSPVPPSPPPAPPVAPTHGVCQALAAALSLPAEQVQAQAALQPPGAGAGAGADAGAGGAQTGELFALGAALAALLTRAGRLPEEERGFVLAAAAAQVQAAEAAAAASPVPEGTTNDI